MNGRIGFVLTGIVFGALCVFLSAGQLDAVELKSYDDKARQDYKTDRNMIKEILANQKKILSEIDSLKSDIEDIKESCRG